MIRNIFLPIDVCERVTHLKIEYSKLYSDVGYEYVTKYFSDEDLINLYKLNEALNLFNAYFPVWGYLGATDKIILSDESEEIANDYLKRHYEFHRVGEKEVLTTISNFFIKKIVTVGEFRDQFTVDYIKYLLSILPAKEIYELPIFKTYLKLIYNNNVD